MTYSYSYEPEPWSAGYIPVMLPADEYPCDCVDDHNPNPILTQRHHVWPLGENGPDSLDNIIPLCGTAHDNVHTLWRAYKANGYEQPSWTYRRQFGHYIRYVVETGIRWMQEGKVGTWETR